MIDCIFRFRDHYFLRSNLVFACDFSETSGEDDKAKEQGVPSTTEVVLPPFGAVNYKAFGNVWIPGTLDSQMIERREESASSWVETLGFTHSDFNFFMSRKFYGRPR